MLAQFKQHIQNDFPFLNKARVLIAISGGIDSIVLTYLFSKLKYNIAIAHVNFQLRAEESDKDEAFVRQLGKDLDIPVFVHLIDTTNFAKTHKQSIQVAARNIRYRWFEKLLKEQDYHYVLTAHNQNDTIETFFINLSRSSGLEGLTGIPTINKQIIRPLLPFSRAEITTFAKENNISWREDQSNAETKYLRNKIRHELIPIIKNIDPNFESAIINSQNHLKESKLLINDYISLVKPKIWKERNDLVYLSLKVLLKLPNYKAVLHELLKDFGFTQWNDIYDLVKAQSGKQIFSDTHFLLKDRVSLVLGVREEEESRDNKQEAREIKDVFFVNTRKYRIEIIDKSNSLSFREEWDEVYFDKNKINYPLYIRKWKKGDYFYPLGMKGKMKLSNFYVNQKISLLEKEKIWLLCDANNQIIWVIGKRIDDRFKITDQTTKIIKISSIA